MIFLCNDCKTPNPHGSIFPDDMAGSSAYLAEEKDVSPEEQRSRPSGKISMYRSRSHLGFSFPSSLHLPRGEDPQRLEP